MPSTRTDKTINYCNCLPSFSYTVPGSGEVISSDGRWYVTRHVMPFSLRCLLPWSALLCITQDVGGLTSLPQELCHAFDRVTKQGCYTILPLVVVRAVLMALILSRPLERGLNACATVQLIERPGFCHA